MNEGEEEVAAASYLREPEGLVGRRGVGRVGGRERSDGRRHALTPLAPLASPPYWWFCLLLLLGVWRGQRSEQRQSQVRLPRCTHHETESQQAGVSQSVRERESKQAGRQAGSGPLAAAAAAPVREVEPVGGWLAGRTLSRRHDGHVHGRALLPAPPTTTTDSSRGSGGHVAVQGQRQVRVPPVEATTIGITNTAARQTNHRTTSRGKGGRQVVQSAYLWVRGEQGGCLLAYPAVSAALMTST